MVKGFLICGPDGIASRASLRKRPKAYVRIPYKPLWNIKKSYPIYC